MRGAEAALRGGPRLLGEPVRRAGDRIRARLGDGAELPEMGVAVQVMVDAEVSGVMFTCNPVSGDPSVVAINASWGLGLAVVGGEVTPDEFLVSKMTGEVVRGRSPRRPSGTWPRDREGRNEPRCRRARSASCLDDAALAALVEVGCRRRPLLGAHQDIEWAIDAPAASCYVLQARPVTALAAARTGATAGLGDRSRRWAPRRRERRH